MSNESPFTISGKKVKDSNLSGKFRNSWVEEAIDFEDQAPGLSIAHTSNYVGTSISFERTLVLMSLFVMGLLIIFARVGYLQFLKGDYYRALAEGNRIRVLPIPAERGIIYDRYQKLLVQNVPGFSLLLSPQDLPRDTVIRNHIIDQVVTLSGVPKEDIEHLITKYGSYSQSIILKENLDYDTALKLYVQNADLPGIQVESTSERNYITSGTSTLHNILSLSHILGYVGKIREDETDAMQALGYLLSDEVGRTGVEKIYENTLRGTSGRKKIEVNAVGREQNVLAVEPPKPGNDLILTIDIEAQKKLEDIVSATADRTGKRRIAAIAMNPNNGEILALVSWPAFDNNAFAHGISTTTYKQYIDDKNLPLFNRAIAGGYPPGSTAKLMVAAAALQEKVITPLTTVNSVGGFMLGGTFFKDWKAGGHGLTNVTKALAWSVNTFFYYVGGGFDKFIGLGVDRIESYMRDFGVGQKTNIDLPGETTGFVPSKEWKKRVKNESWFVGDTYNLSIGEGEMLTTPLQAALWTAIVANNGTVITPHVAQKLADPITNATTTLVFASHPIGTVSAENLAVVRQGMRDCVIWGSCQLLKTLPFETGGKTGTAQWNNNKQTHAWFTSFAPYNRPQIVVTVLVEEGGEGSVIAMPIARDFLDWWGRNYLKK